MLKYIKPYETHCHSPTSQALFSSFAGLVCICIRLLADLRDGILLWPGLACFSTFAVTVDCELEWLKSTLYCTFILLSYIAILCVQSTTQDA